ncbi:CHAT domain-containing protein [Leptothoe sp. PORK10 BA2]|uniref:CHAT domain-containing protein n=1 Tax=Leptothoe sp. PORK10 BA2 TaxID=3110254 RepID=UPI002B20E5BB|nr:CHAT domain-containing protein [Leptothoe sp. PORK10 BA2]MEA5464726.1 CHAT domain-containing protein [Leptothoe sp. PORK10 BA2]
MPQILRRPVRRLLSILFLLGFTLALWVGHGLPRLGASYAATPAQFVQEGVSLYQTGDYQGAVDRWQTALKAYPPGDSSGDQAIVHENLARAYQLLGKPSAAIDSWAAAEALYRQLSQAPQVGRMLTEQAQIYLSLGQQRRAIALLCLPKTDTAVDDCEPSSALPIAIAASDTLGQVAALGSLGEAYRLQGDYQEAEKLLGQGLGLARDAGYGQFEVPMLNSLGSISSRQAQISFRRAEGVKQTGLEDIADVFFQEAQSYESAAQQSFAAALATAQRQASSIGEFQTLLNFLPIYRRQQATDSILATRQRLGVLIDQLPASREVAYGAIALGRSYQPVGTAFRCVIPGNEAQAKAWLERGAEIAAQISDDRAESFALGELGHLAECQGAFKTAMTLTQQAQVKATQDLGSADSLYLWQWQAGRIYRQQGKAADALAAYHQSIATLDSIRTEILVADQDVQFDFRDTIEPVYRELIDLQLATVSNQQQVASKQNSPPSAATDAAQLEAALVTADSLRLAELQNYFGNDCILSPVAEARVDLLAQSSRTAVISSVVFPDRTALIANIPNQLPKLVWINDSQQLQETVIKFRLGLEDLATEPFDTTIAEQLYRQMISPLEDALQNAKIDTLVFIHDQFLRSVPMAALHDGQQFLVEKYAVATTPALTLTAPSNLQPEDLRALVLGSSQEVRVGSRVFPALPSVPAEIESVVSQLPGSKALLDNDFSESGLRQALQADRFPILHFATHGLFSPDPEDNFIITGQGEKVTFGQLESFIRSSTPGNQQVDLVMLTACETAIGDDRATLGLAGVAIRAGARSAIASLWQADDRTTAQITQDFYQFLKDPSLNKAQALQQAQIRAIHRGASVLPGMWAPLVLVGNWL